VSGGEYIYIFFLPFDTILGGWVIGVLNILPLGNWGTVRKGGWGGSRDGHARVTDTGGCELRTG
jgi:hypothetical protein